MSGIKFEHDTSCTSVFHVKAPCHVACPLETRLNVSQPYDSRSGYFLLFLRVLNMVFTMLLKEPHLLPLWWRINTQPYSVVLNCAITNALSYTICPTGKRAGAASAVGIQAEESSGEHPGKIRIVPRLSWTSKSASGARSRLSVASSAATRTRLRRDDGKRAYSSPYFNSRDTICLSVS